MKNKKVFFIILIILIIIGITTIIIIKQNGNKENTEEEIQEYTPQEEISDEQMRETIVTLYFLNSETKELKSEGRLINATELLQDPYKTIVQLLIEGPKNSELENVFPENTRLLETKIENNCVTLNFSEEILNYENDVQKYNIINSILNSLTQLNEVNSIKILINNETNEDFNEEYTAIY